MKIIDKVTNKKITLKEGLWFIKNFGIKILFVSRGIKITF